MEDDSIASVASSTASTSQKTGKSKPRYFILVEDAEDNSWFPKAKGVLYALSTRASANDIMKGLKERGVKATMLLENRKGKVTAA